MTAQAVQKSMSRWVKKQDYTSSLSYMPAGVCLHTSLIASSTLIAFSLVIGPDRQLSPRFELSVGTLH